MPAFNPIDVLKPASVPPPANYRFQVNHFALDGDLAKEARAAASRFSLSNADFVTACVKFALENMEGA